MRFAGGTAELARGTVEPQWRPRSAARWQAEQGQGDAGHDPGRGRRLSC